MLYTEPVIAQRLFERRKGERGNDKEKHLQRSRPGIYACHPPEKVPFSPVHLLYCLSALHTIPVLSQTATHVSRKHVTLIISRMM